MTSAAVRYQGSRERPYPPHGEGWALVDQVDGEARRCAHSLATAGALPLYSYLDVPAHDGRSYRFFAFDVGHGAQIGALRRTGAAAGSLTADLSDAFFTKGQAMGERLGLDFADLLLVMAYESGISAAAENPSSGAVGLIQFMDLPGVGYSGTPEAFRGLTAEQQLPYVERYLAPYASQGLTSAPRIWQAVLGPATLSDPSGLVYSSTGTRFGGTEAADYAANSQLDATQKGSITVDDLAHALASNVHGPIGPRYREAIARYDALTTSAPSSSSTSSSSTSPSPWLIAAAVAAVGALAWAVAGAPGIGRLAIA